MANSCSTKKPGDTISEPAPIMVFGIKKAAQDADYQDTYQVVFRTAETYWEPWIPGTFSKEVAEGALKKMLSKHAWEHDYLGVV